MEESENKDFASAADLLGLSSGEQEVVLKTCGMKIKIRKITIGEISDIAKSAKESEMEQYMWMVFKCLIRPKLNMDEIRKLKFEVLAEIASAIAKFSGLDREGVDRTKNLLGVTESLTPPSN